MTLTLHYCVTDRCILHMFKIGPPKSAGL